MTRRTVAVPAALVLVGFAIGPVDAAGQGSAQLRASLDGAREVGGGDGNGRGTFRGEFRGRRLCYRLRFARIDEPIAAHIHDAPAGQNGSVVVDLRPRFTDDGSRTRCVSVDASLRRAIRRRPRNFYVNVHTRRYPDGAIRGQLSLRRRR